MCQVLFCFNLYKIKKVIYIEIWKDISGYEGYYQISNLGNIRSLDRIITGKNGKKQTKQGVIMKDRMNTRLGRREIYLCKDGHRRAFKVYRLVALEFIYNDDPINKTTVNHIDGNIDNNISDNLEWASYSENLQHAYDKLNRVVNRSSGKKRKCYVYYKLFGTSNVYSSIMEAARNINVSETQIRRISNGECINYKYEITID